MSDQSPHCELSLPYSESKRRADSLWWIIVILIMELNLELDNVNISPTRTVPYCGLNNKITRLSVPHVTFYSSCYWCFTKKVQTLRLSAFLHHLQLFSNGFRKHSPVLWRSNLSLGKLKSNWTERHRVIHLRRLITLRWKGPLVLLHWPFLTLK